MFNTRLLLSLLVFALSTPVLAGDTRKEIVGYVERVEIMPGNLVLKAKVDSGADISSLHCKCSTPIRKGGEEWLRFTVESDTGTLITLERKIERWARIKRHFGEEQKRAVVKIGICMGSTYRETEVSVVDRSGFEFPLLIGRRYMNGYFLIDPEKEYISKAQCFPANNE
jgi:hypothetical protein